MGGAPASRVSDSKPDLAQYAVIRPQGCAQGAASVPRRRLDKDLVKSGFVEHAAVGDAVQRYPSGHAQRLHAGQAVDLRGNKLQTVEDHERILRPLARADRWRSHATQVWS